MSGRGKRVLVYTAALLIAPMPLMPYVVGTREFALALIASSAILTPASFYVMRGEWRLKYRPLVGTKMLAASSITFLLGVGMLVGSIVYLVRV